MTRPRTEPENEKDNLRRGSVEGGSTKKSASGKSGNLVFKGKVPWKDEQGGKSVL